MVNWLPKKGENWANLRASCKAQASTEVTTHKSRLRYIHNSCFTFAMWNAHIIKVHFNVSIFFSAGIAKKKEFWTLVTFHPAAKLISGLDRAGEQKKAHPIVELTVWVFNGSQRWNDSGKSCEIKSCWLRNSVENSSSGYFRDVTSF